MAFALPKTPQSLIDAWRPHRDRLRPQECDHRDGCWVYDPYGGLARGRYATMSPRCAACGGKLAVMTPSRRPPC